LQDSTALLQSDSIWYERVKRSIDARDGKGARVHHRRFMTLMIATGRARIPAIAENSDTLSVLL
jgi:hypothetical protein